MKTLWPTEDLRKLAVEMVKTFGGDLLDQKPIDLREYGVQFPSNEFYAELLAALCKYESNYNTDATYKEAFDDAKGHPVISRGLLQISIESANGYGAKLTREDELHKPEVNLRCGVLIMRKWIKADGCISGGSAGAWRGMARYWSPFRKPDRVAEMRVKLQQLFKNQEQPKESEPVNKYQKAYDTAYAEMGQTEIAGAKDNPRIVEYHQATSLKASDDETPWCASFVNWVLKQMGEKGTNSAAAKSFATWGKELAEPVRGCIAVFTRDGGGHVAFVDHVAGDMIYCLGGNQSNKVCISAYAKSRLLGYRGFADVATPPSSPDVSDANQAALKDAKMRLQSALNGVGANPALVVDGIVGPKTKAALNWAAASLK